METELVVIVVLQALTVGILLWALNRANRAKSELEELLEPVLRIGKMLGDKGESGEVKVMKRLFAKVFGDSEKPDKVEEKPAPSKLTAIMDDPNTKKAIGFIADSLTGILGKKEESPALSKDGSSPATNVQGRKESQS